MSKMPTFMTPHLYEYYQQVGYREPDLLKDLREDTQKLPMAQMQILPEQGQCMALLVQLMGAKKILEIGTFKGYSALAMAYALPPDGKIITCDINQEWTAVAEQYWQKAGVAHQIDLRIAPAVDTLQQLIDNGAAGTFDFAFIDADKGLYDQYYEHCLTLLRTGGLVAIDNVLWHGDVADATNNNATVKVLRALNQKIHDDKRVMPCMLTIGDGLTLARKC